VSREVFFLVLKRSMKMCYEKIMKRIMKRGAERENDPASQLYAERGSFWSSLFI
jgi:hypothetical protein